jgi:MFS transporter, DHA3 family, macrolide efflux protein
VNIFGVLRRFHIFLLWTSQVLSTIGDSLYQIAIILIAVKMVGSEAGFVGAVESATFFAFGLFGGAYADRWNRRWTMMSVDILRAITVLLLATLALTSLLQFYQLIIISILVGSLGAFFDPALKASLPALAQDEKALQSTNALMDLTRRLARIAGPFLAGILIGFLPLPHFFTLDGISFIISALAIFALGSKFAWRAVERRDSQPKNVKLFNANLFKEMGGALRLLWSLPYLRGGLIVHGITSGLYCTAFIVGAALFATRMMSGNPGTYGLMIGAYGIGNVSSSLILGSIMIRRRVPFMFVGKIILGAGFVLMVSTRSLPIVLLGAGLAGMGGPFFDIMSSVIIQTYLPANQIGKISSVSILIEEGGNFLGLLLAVPLFTILNAPLGVTLCGLLMSAAGFFGLIFFGRKEPTISVDKSESIVSVDSSGLPGA